MSQRTHGFLTRTDLVGQRFGKLTALRFSHLGARSHSYWVWRCDCGTEKVIMGYHVTSGEVLSCGCYRKLFFQSGGSSAKRCSFWKASNGDCCRGGKCRLYQSSTKE